MGKLADDISACFPEKTGKFSGIQIVNQELVDLDYGTLLKDAIKDTNIPTLVKLKF